jgi:hypothetical protein
VILPQSPHLCQNSGLSISSSIRETEKCRVGGRQHSCCFWSKIPWWEKKCETVCCHEATASSFITKVWVELFAHFHAVAVKWHSSMRNLLFGLPGRILYEQSSWCQRKWWASSCLALQLSRLFFLSVMNRAFHSNTCVQLIFSSPNILSQYSTICTKFDAVPLLDPSQNHIRPDTRLQMKACKKSAGPPSYVKFCTLTPKTCQYYHFHCTELLQLLHSWQHQSRILWIPS